MLDMTYTKVILILIAIGILVRGISTAIKESNWLTEAQERQDKRFENSAPPIRSAADRDREKRLKRYQEYRRSQGNGPTYEEWKAAKLAEEKEKHSGI